MEGDTRRPTADDLLRDAAWASALARHLVRDAGTADDLVQETWLAALARRWTGRGPSRAWLATVMRNAARQRARDESGRDRRERERAEALPSSGDLLERVERQHVLVEAVRALAEPYRRTILLRYYEGRSAAEIARSQGVPAATVRSRLKRALAMLEARLSAEYGGRERWLEALVPLALGGRPGRGFSVADWAVHTRDLLYSPAALASAALGVGGSIWWCVHAIERPRALPGRPHVASTVSAATERLVPLQAPMVDERRDLDEPDTPPVDVAAAASSGWWLAGHVRGIDAHDPDPVRIHVRALGGDVDGSLDAIVAPGDVEIDLSDLFVHPTLLCDALFVTVEHPGHVPVRVDLWPRQYARQAGFRPGEIVRFPLDVTLEPTPAVLRGRVVTPEGQRVLLRLLSFSGPDDELGSVGNRAAVWCAPDGSYALPAEARGRHRIVVLGSYIQGDGRLPRPAHVDVDVVGGDQRVEPIALDDPGVALEGRVLLDGVVSESLRLRLLRPGGHGPAATDLLWTGSRYAYQVLCGSTDHEGHFSFTGLEPGRYALAIDALDAACGRVPMLHGVGSPEVLEIPAPVSGATVAFGRRLVLLEVADPEGPLEGAAVVLVSRSVRGSTRRARATTGSSGRIALAIGGIDALDERVTIEKDGFVPRDLPVDEWTESGWSRVELRPASDFATLELRVEGDPLRLAEQFLVRVERLDGPSSGDEREELVRRLGDVVRLEGLRAGRYKMRFDPTLHGDPCFDALVLPEVLECTLDPGQNRAALRLRDGSRIRIVDAARQRQPEATEFRVLDGGGEELALEAVHRFDPRGISRSEGWLPRGERIESNDLFPNLEAGTYTLEIREGDCRLERHAIVLQAGAVTEVTIGR